MKELALSLESVVAGAFLALFFFLLLVIVILLDSARSVQSAFRGGPHFAIL